MGRGGAEETGGVRAENTAWEEDEDEESYSPPAVANMHFKDDARPSQLLLLLLLVKDTNGNR